jgi:hypothetical protein
VCPFLDKAYTRCSAHLTLRNLTQAIAYCANHYSACLIYQDFIENDGKKEQANPQVGALAAP